MSANWIGASTTTTGTGTLTLTALAGHVLPSAAFAPGTLVAYSLVASDGTFEAGIGTIGASDTLARTLIRSTYNGTTYNNTTAAALNLPAGTHKLYITEIAENNYRASRAPLQGHQALSTHLSASASTGIALVNNRPYAWPFRLESAGLVTGFAIWVGTAGAGSTLQLGLYDNATNGRPGKLITKLATPLDTSSTGDKTGAALTNARVSPGNYWIAALGLSGTAPQLRAHVPNISVMGVNTWRTAIQLYNASTEVDLTDPFPTGAITVNYYDEQNSTVAPRLIITP